LIQEKFINRSVMFDLRIREIRVNRQIRDSKSAQIRKSAISFSHGSHISALIFE